MSIRVTAIIECDNKGHDKEIGQTIINSELFDALPTPKDVRGVLSRARNVASKTFGWQLDAQAFDHCGQCLEGIE